MKKSVVLASGKDPDHYRACACGGVKKRTSKECRACWLGKARYVGWGRCIHCGGPRNRSNNGNGRCDACRLAEDRTRHLDKYRCYWCSGPRTRTASFCGPCWSKSLEAIYLRTKRRCSACRKGRGYLDGLCRACFVRRETEKKRDNTPPCIKPGSRGGNPPRRRRVA